MLCTDLCSVFFLACKVFKNLRKIKACVKRHENIAELLNRLEKTVVEIFYYPQSCFDLTVTAKKSI